MNPTEVEFIVLEAVQDCDTQWTLPLTELSSWKDHHSGKHTFLISW